MAEACSVDIVVLGGRRLSCWLLEWEAAARSEENVTGSGYKTGGRSVAHAPQCHVAPALRAPARIGRERTQGNEHRDKTPHWRCWIEISSGN
jgi:hypothetical protein